MSSYETTQNVPPEVLEDIRKQEKQATEDGILSGLVREDGHSTPLPEKKKAPPKSWAWVNGW